MSTKFGTGQESGKNGHTVGRQAADQAMADAGADSVDFCQVFCSTRYEYEDVLSGIRDTIGMEAELLGCSSSGEFTEDGVEAGSVVVSVVESDTMRFFTSMETGLSEDPHDCVFRAVNDLPRKGDPELSGYPHRAAINLHDGLAGIGHKVSRFTKEQLDSDVKLAGGSAGDDLQLETTHVFCGNRVATDAVGIALIAAGNPIPMTVNHGHEPISEPMTVTEADGSTVHELDGKPAFEAWQEAVRESGLENYDIDVADLEDESDDLSFMLTRYEFGIESEAEGSSGLLDRLRDLLLSGRSTSGYNIRWPGLTTQTHGPLEFAVEIPEGTDLRVMHSAPDDQVTSVRDAARRAVDGTNGTDVAGGFVYDCVCRATILEDEFERVVDAIDEEVDASFAGFETYGEVCTESDELTEYHNTSSVVMLLPE